MLEAIIFDFDGLLLETEMPDYISWQEVYQQHGCELPLSVWLDHVGTSSDHFNPYDYLETLIHSTLDRDQIRQTRRRRFQTMMADQSLMPGVTAALRFAQEASLQLALASSSSYAWVAGFLKRFDLLQTFEAICTSDDVVRVKPDPALYALALARLDVAPTAALAIEDSRNGMLAAQGAGLRCLVVPNQITRHSNLDEADWQFSSLADVDWQQIHHSF